MIIRVFRARVRDGKQQQFEKFFLSKALANVRAHPGLVSVTVGKPLEVAPNDFLMITVWRDVEALKSFTGEHWQEPVIDPEEVDLLSEVFAHHYEEVPT
jgi:quinol monooxygenase YgiN